MNQSELDRQVAQATGESVHLIRHRGFHAMEANAAGEFASTDSRPPMVVDWDALEIERRHVESRSAVRPTMVA
jgi:hypothetical protein